jgi:predicted amidohydrolase YtcJ
MDRGGAARGAAGAARPRNRIEHVQLLHPGDMGRLARCGIIASMQPLHATSDMLIAERHWGARCAGAYAWKSLLDAGTVLAFGSDCPVEVADPLAGIHAAVTRRRADGSPGPDGWRPQQRLSVEQALHAYTRGAAYAAGREADLGSIAPGKFADLTILDRDILAVAPHDIRSVKVGATVVGGIMVFCAM